LKKKKNGIDERVLCLKFDKKKWCLTKKLEAEGFYRLPRTKFEGGLW